MDAKELARLLKVLSVEARVRIVQLLKGRALCVSALAARLDVTQGAVSQHLRIMRDAGLVIDEKRGCFVHYRLNEDILSEWQEQTRELLDPKTGTGATTKGVGTCAATTRSKGAKSRTT
jgi:DNA-binding transcriptional ArsR family regulator